MTKQKSKRSVDQEFTAPTSFDKIYSVVTESAEKFLLSRQIDEQDVHVVSVLIDMFLLLCYKWILSSKINETDKAKIEQAQAEVREFRFKIESKMNLKEMPSQLGLFPFELPKTSDEARVAQLERLGLHNAYISENELPPSLDHIFEGTVSPRTLSERIEREHPMPLFLPRTTDKRRALQLERMGYLNALVDS